MQTVPEQRKLASDRKSEGEAIASDSLHGS